MNIERLTKHLSLLVTVGLLASCKISVLVPEGGSVSSAGSATCNNVTAGQACVIDVPDTNFGTQFIALPDPFFVFDHWYDAPGFLCAGSTTPSCIADNTVAANVPIVEAFVATKQALYIMPVFKRDVATVTVDGKEWLRPSLFVGLSYDDIIAQCPGGVCGVGSVLLGQTMNGFALATQDDVNGLFNAVIGSVELVGTDHYSEIDSTWAPVLLSIFGPTGTSSDLAGWTNTPWVPGFFFIGYSYDATSGLLDAAATDFPGDQSSVVPDTGAWFYRTPTP